RIMDPACGSGQFLTSVFKRLRSLYTNIGISIEEAGRRIVLHNLIGYDSDPTAVYIARHNLSMLSGLPVSEITSIRHNDFIYKDSLSLEQDTLSEDQYDLIIGNPPWGSTLTPEEKKYYRAAYYSAKSGINTFTLFIERSLELLKEKGRLSFLVPEALLNIRAHRNCREMLITHTQIQNINLWGDQFKGVYAPAISFCCVKDTTHNKDNTITINDVTHKRFDTMYVKQAAVRRVPEHIISIHFTVHALDIIEHMNTVNCYYLKDSARFFLGIVTGNNPRFLSDSRSEDTPDPILTGRDITPYRAGKAGTYFRYDPDALQQTAPRELYLTKNKIIYKFIGKRLTFAMDREGHYTLNNVNGFIPDMETVTPEAMLAILNSSLIQYFYEKNFFTIKVLRGNLERLPLKKLSGEAEKLLTGLALEAMNADGLSENKRIQDTIDDIVFHEYDITEKNAYRIWEEYNSSKGQQILPNH
ncbi:MAG: TaqI-like C-terminal specificity domain-containing protein, partial [Spirochaetota bacterium]